MKNWFEDFDWMLFWILAPAIIMILFFAYMFYDALITENLCNKHLLEQENMQLCNTGRVHSVYAADNNHTNGLICQCKINLLKK